ncbi:MAG: DUF512 domain-containing protein [Dehalococcoidia bacterium]|nr:DUF512 domain-containing protein [Dehalococcoidia bacterium]
MALALPSLPTLTDAEDYPAVVAVDPGSVADELGVLPGDRLVSLNGRTLRDIIDYRFHAAADVVTIDIYRHGERLTFEVEKDPDEPLGIDFGVALFDDIIRCNNNCYFCFIGGNNRGMRRSLFIKDDDFRLSFLFGNFATLTNLTDADWRRIEEQHLSPLYVSVHSTELELRRKLLANPRSGDILSQIDRLTGMGIQCHCQLVICPGLNDGEHLDRSIEDLAARHPGVLSIAVVPVGLTEMNQIRGAHKLKVPEPLKDQLLTPDYARRSLDQVQAHQRRFLRAFGDPLVFASDEYYLAAGASLPHSRHYGTYPQFENGVGMVRWLMEDWKKTKARFSRGTINPGARSMTLACGTLIAPVLEPMVAEMRALTGVDARLVAVPNRTYGVSINCAGLLPAHDFLTALADEPLGEVVVLPRYALDDAGEIFLDDVTPAQIEQRLGRSVVYVKQMSQLFESLPRRRR